MNIPALKGTRGVFDIFVPGLFLQLNILIFIAFLPVMRTHIQGALVMMKDNQWILLATMSVLSYLLGVILRMFRAETADRLSAWYIQKTDKPAKKFTNTNYDETVAYAFENFPYLRWLEYVYTNRFTKDPKSFFEKIWKGRIKKNFFNFAKTVISIHDERAAIEMIAAEELSRYTASMLYSLMVAVLFLLVDLIINLFYRTSMPVWLLLIMTAYLIMIREILRSYRYMRIKEVETVFAATYKNQDLLKE